MKNFFITLIVSILVTVATFFCSPLVLGNTASGDDKISEVSEEGLEDLEGEDSEGDDPEGDDSEGDDSEGDDPEPENSESKVKQLKVAPKVKQPKVAPKVKQPKVKQHSLPKPKANANSVSSIASKDFLDLLKDPKKWSNYDKANIEFSYDFTPLDVSGAKISKKNFLEKQATGEFIASKKENMVYQLNKMPSDISPKIIKKAKGNASTALGCLKQEGRSFPNFKTKDIKGKVFSKDLAKGKILVVKCWFVQCLPCVKEFPELNHIYDKYESSDKIEFLSFAFDKEEKINKFLAKKEFRYPVIADQTKFIKKQIKATKYPLHVIVGKDGKILKMFNNVDILEHFIEKYK